MITKIKDWWFYHGADVILYGVLVLLCSFLIWMFSLVGFDMNVQAKCAKFGYPENITTWNYKAYCVRTINQTQYVIPLNELLGK